MPEFFTTTFASVSGQLYVLLGLTLADAILGTAIAIVYKKFKWDKLTGYLQSDLLPILGWFVMSFIGAIPASFVPQGVALAIPQVIYVTVFVRILASILASLASIGVVPGALNKVGIEPKFLSKG